MQVKSNTGCVDGFHSLGENRRNAGRSGVRVVVVVVWGGGVFCVWAGARVCVCVCVCVCACVGGGGGEGGLGVTNYVICAVPGDSIHMH